ncbi:hypothetical protein GURASL_07250 [Geotalea uraniireducens]|uniref:DUF3108 domain-containing protein n=1 Tax=Geotalea uraniireducens TaxID=351604 RepID=A0ABM8EHA3_9BACT|nr:DUF3108 domain-containing protein [Geotalea uraniireducens]BDV41802.1 hypothetical protein GURASL_07250 [Geotalea uraniireducens]
MVGSRLAVIATMLLLVCGALPVDGADRVPEVLTYELTWTGIPVGVASQEIFDDGANRRIVSTARSNDWLSVFFPVEDPIESRYNPHEGQFPGQVRHYRLQTREGRHHRDREIEFLPAQGIARFRDNLSGEQAAVAIPPGTIDVYGSFYLVRYLPLEVGVSHFVEILDSKRQRRIEVRVLRKERLKTVLGDVETIVIQPLVKSEGVFEGKGSVLIWLTDDSRRVPVRARTKVTVGSVTATLVKRLAGE